MAIAKALWLCAALAVVGVVGGVATGCGGPDKAPSSSGSGERTSTGRQAVLSNNGLEENGLTSNGLFGNGLFGNGLFGNGLFGNGLFGNGLFGNGLFGNGLFGNGLFGNGLFGNGLFGNGLAGSILANNAYARELLQYIYSCAMPTGTNATMDPSSGMVACSQSLPCGAGYTCSPSTNTCVVACSAQGTSPQGSCDAGYICSSKQTCVIPLTGWIGVGINVDGSGWWQPPATGTNAGNCDLACQRWVTACVLARTNAYGVHVEISMRAPSDAPSGIQQALSTSTAEVSPCAAGHEADPSCGYTQREGAYYGNIFATTGSPTSGPIVEAPAYYACAGPESNVPEITKRFCSSQGDQVDINVPGVCLATATEGGTCEGQDTTTGAMQDCHPSTSATPTVCADSSDPSCYNEVITVYLKQPIATCGNGVCEPPVEDQTCCPADCHPSTWAKDFPPTLNTGSAYQAPPVEFSPNAMSAIGSDSSVVVAGNACVTSGTGASAVCTPVNVCSPPSRECPLSLGNAVLPPSDGMSVIVKYNADGSYAWPAANAIRFGSPPPVSYVNPLQGVSGLVVGTNTSSAPTSPDHKDNITVAGVTTQVGTPNQQLWISSFGPDGTPLGTWIPPLVGGPTLSPYGGTLAFDSQSNLVMAVNAVTPATTLLTNARAVSVGDVSACALLSGGTVECWGYNGDGELGDGTTTGPATCFGVACSTTPVAVSGLTGATAISVGNNFACALLSGGTVQCWGDNARGQLGIGTTTGPATCPSSGDPCSSTPVAVSGLTGATAISAGTLSACALLSGGTVECWGFNGNGELGNGTTTSSTVPVAVPGLTGATAISARGLSACALLSGGTVECWGNNQVGELGNGTTTDSTTPVAVSGLTGVTAISAGTRSACALLSDGTVECWGDNVDGELGNGTTTNSTTPVAVSGLSGATAISAGNFYSTCALLSGGTVACWGDNRFGQLGEGTTTGPATCPSGGDPCSLTPVAVSGLTGAAAISGGGYTPCALLSGGTVECWGGNAYGELGNGATTNSSLPVAVSAPLNTPPTSPEPTAVSVGFESACALLSGGTVECWGNNTFGELGNGTTTNSSTPVAVSGLTGATAISVGENLFACALLSSGKIECWGNNQYGQLANGTIGGLSTMPVPVPGLTGVTAVSLGGNSACALLSSGTVECWGDNRFGELGNGTTTDSSTPVAVSGLIGATAISMGRESACALLSSGTVECWGDNFYGQLGNGTTTASTTPVAVLGLTGATAVSVAFQSACALLSDGTVECWGLNQVGQLGNGTTTASTTPVAVSGLTGAKAISAALGDSPCALLSGGTVECWGYNFDGQLGNGTTTGPATCGGSACATTPVAVSGLTSAQAISVGLASACEFPSGGTVECWGYNQEAQLGNGTTNNSSLPVAIVQPSFNLSAGQSTFVLKMALPSGSPQASVAWVSGIGGTVGGLSDTAYFPQSLALDPNGNVVLVTSDCRYSATLIADGSCAVFSPTLGVLRKVCSDGVTDPTKTCPDSSLPWVTAPGTNYSAAIVGGGAIYAGGLSSTSTTGGTLGAPFVQKFDTNGNPDPQWTPATPTDACPANSSCASSPAVQGVRMGFDGGGNVILASFGNPAVGGGIDFGGTTFPTFPTYGSPNIFLSAYDPVSGALQWAKQIQTILSSSVHGLALGNQGQIVVSGNYSGSMEVDGQLLVTTDSEEPTVVDSFLASFAEPAPSTPTIGSAGVCGQTGLTIDTVPSNIVVEATSPAGACVFFMPPTSTAVGSDGKSSGATVTCAPQPPNTTFKIGQTTETCTAYDAFGGSASAPSFTVTVLEPPPPVLTGIPGPITVQETSPSGATVTYTPYLADPLNSPTSCSSCAGPPSPGGPQGPPSVCIPPVVPATCTPPSGATFALGTKTVTCTGSDPQGRTANATFPVTVVDNFPPVIKVPANITAPATGQSGAVVTFAATATDPIYGPLPASSVSCSPASGSTFAPGTTTVTCTATNPAGKKATGSFLVQVQCPSLAIQPPINANGSSVFKLGSTVPVKFRLTGACAGITSAVATLSVAKITSSVTGTTIEAVSTSSATTGNAFRYDPTSAQYIFNLATKTLSTGTWQLSIDLHDGKPRPVNISLK